MFDSITISIGTYNLIFLAPKQKSKLAIELSYSWSRECRSLGLNSQIFSLAQRNRSRARHSGRPAQSLTDAWFLRHLLWIVYRPLSFARLRAAGIPMCRSIYIINIYTYVDIARARTRRSKGPLRGRRSRDLPNFFFAPNPSIYVRIVVCRAKAVKPVLQSRGDYLEQYERPLSADDTYRLYNCTIRVHFLRAPRCFLRGKNTHTVTSRFLSSVSDVIFVVIVLYSVFVEY